jgi:hypothetical protein
MGRYERLLTEGTPLTALLKSPSHIDDTRGFVELDGE